MQPVKTKKKLSRADKKQIEAAIVRANRTDKKGKSAQDSIPYERMWPDGICRISDSHYTKIIQFQDINYQLSQNEDKTAIFEGWCDFLNYFDSSIHFQLSFLNLAASEETFATPTLGMTQKNQPQIKYTLDFDVTPHQLRHTYITNLLYAGVDPKTVQYLAGHENSKTTMDIYAKVKYNKPEELFGVVNGAFHQAIAE